MDISKNYTCDHTPPDRMFVDDNGQDRLNISVREGSRDAGVVLSKFDAIDFAWSILERYEVAKRPAQAFKVGDFITVERESSSHNGFLGRVMEVRDTGGYISLNVTDLAGDTRWVGGNDAKRLTPDEFRTHVNTRITEMMDIP